MIDCFIAKEITDLSSLNNIHEKLTKSFDKMLDLKIKLANTPKFSRVYGIYEIRYLDKSIRKGMELYHRVVDRINSYSEKKIIPYDFVGEYMKKENALDLMNYPENLKHYEEHINSPWKNGCNLFKRKIEVQFKTFLTEEILEKEKNNFWEMEIIR